MRNRLWLILLFLMPALLPACYHMRAEPEPIATRNNEMDRVSADIMRIFKEYR